MSGQLGPEPTPVFSGRTPAALGPGALVAALALGLLLGFAVDPIRATGSADGSAAPSLAPGTASAPAATGPGRPATPIPTSRPSPRPTMDLGDVAWPPVLRTIALAQDPEDILRIQLTAPGPQEPVWTMAFRLTETFARERVIARMTAALVAAGISDAEAWTTTAGPSTIVGSGATAIVRDGAEPWLILSVDMTALVDDGATRLTEVPTTVAALQGPTWGCETSQGWPWPPAGSRWQPPADHPFSKVVARLVARPYDQVTTWACWRNGALRYAVIAIDVIGSGADLAYRIREALSAEIGPATASTVGPGYGVVVDSDLQGTIREDLGLTALDTDSGRTHWTAVIWFGAAHFDPVPTIPPRPAPSGVVTLP